MPELNWFAKGYLIFLAVILFVLISGFIGAYFEQRHQEKEQREREEFHNKKSNNSSS